MGNRASNCPCLSPFSRRPYSNSNHSMAGNSVQVNVYDLSRGLAKQWSLPLVGKQIDGIWHTGVVVFGREYFFGAGGILSTQPGQMSCGQAQQTLDIGHTTIAYEAFQDFLQQQKQDEFKGEKYHLFDHNCNTFSSVLVKFLTGCDIPAHIRDLPSDILNTPFGAMLRPTIDQLSEAASQSITPAETKHTTQNMSPVGTRSPPKTGTNLQSMSAGGFRSNRSSPGTSPGGGTPNSRNKKHNDHIHSHEK